MLRHETVIGWTHLAVHEPEVRRRELHRTLDHCLEERSEIESRAAHRSEDFCDGGLLVQRLLGLVEQAHVLDRDDGLVRERLKQVDLLIRERAHLHSAQSDRPDGGRAANERCDDRAAPPVLRSLLRAARILVCRGLDVGYGERAALDERTPIHRLAIDWIRKGSRYRDRSGVSRESELAACREHDDGVLSRAELRGALRDRVEHRLDLGRRGRDDPEDLADRGLPFEGILRLGDKARVLDRDRRLIGEGPHEIDLVRGERTDLLSGQRQHAHHLVVMHKRHAQTRAHAEREGFLAVSLGLAVRSCVANMEGSPRAHHVLHDERHLHGLVLAGPLAPRQEAWALLHTRAGGEAIALAVDEEEAAVAVRGAELSGALDDRVENGLKVERGPTHHPQYLGERGLPREGLGEPAVQIPGRGRHSGRGRHRGRGAIRLRRYRPTTWPKQSAQPLHPPDCRPSY